MREYLKKHSHKLKKAIISVDEYRKKYLKKLQSGNLNKYFDSMTEISPGVEIYMVKFGDSEYVPGGAWPGNYGRLQITDYTKYKTRKGRKRIDISPTECIYEDSPDMHDLVPYELTTTEKLIESQKKYEKYSLFNIPRRFYDEYAKQLIVTIQGQKAQGNQLTDQMLDEVLKRMTKEEFAQYLKKINRINIDLYPSVELPITVRIDGNDDGAMERQFESMDKVKSFIEEHECFNFYRITLENEGFKNTD
jgi:hypothetical protein